MNSSMGCVECPIVKIVWAESCFARKLALTGERMELLRSELLDQRSIADFTLSAAGSLSVDFALAHFWARRSQVASDLPSIVSCVGRGEEILRTLIDTQCGRP